jgi:hypothetical protein
MTTFYDYEFTKEFFIELVKFLTYDFDDFSFKDKNGNLVEVSFLNQESVKETISFIKLQSSKYSVTKDVVRDFSFIQKFKIQCEVYLKKFIK